MIEVRPATLDDIPKCAEAGRRFYEFSPYTGVPYDEDSMRDLMESMIDQKMLIVAFNDGAVIGGIGGNLAPIFFNKKYTMAYEMFWWVDPEHRGKLGLKLLSTFESTALELGCSYLMMMTLAKNEVGALYERLGFSQSETGYIKRL
jgi:GNAT superfamily N-acetyltransferase